MARYLTLPCTLHTNVIHAVSTRRLHRLQQTRRRQSDQQCPGSLFSLLNTGNHGREPAALSSDLRRTCSSVDCLRGFCDTINGGLYTGLVDEYCACLAQPSAISLLSMPFVCFDPASSLRGVLRCFLTVTVYIWQVDVIHVIAA